MEFQSATASTPPAKTMHFVFFNERELRSGWRLLIYAGILVVLAQIATVAFKLVSRALRLPQGQGNFSLVAQGLGEVALFLVVLLASWIMARIEHRKTGVYGLPLIRSAMSRFAVGYVAWGFLPLTLVLLILRGLGVFYFGSVAFHAAEALYWGAAWALVFLAVALFEEYSFRGYPLYTLSDGIGFWPAAILLAAAFAGVHMGNGGESRIGIAGVFLYAIFAAATLRRTGNLWLAVGAHAGWDWGQSFFYGVSDSGFQAPGHLFNPRIQAPDWLGGGSVGPEGSIVALVFWALLTVGFLIFYPPRREQGQAVMRAADR